MDREAGLRLCAVQPALYAQLLQLLVTGQSDFAARFDAAVQADDSAAALRPQPERIGAQNIGAMGVAAAAAELEQACQEPSDRAALAALRDQVLTALARVLQEIEGA